MEIVPNWMSNIHPLIIHFPIVLLIIAVVADLTGLVLKKYSWLSPSALALYVLGALSTVAAYFSGKQAADVVDFPPPSYPVISEHADLALYTMLFFGIYALIRLFLRWKGLDRQALVGWGLFFIAAGGLFLVKETAEHGAELVYRHGVGTAIENSPANEAPAEEAIRNSAFTLGADGSWTFQTGSDAAEILRENFRLFTGKWDNLILESEQAPDGTPILKISTVGKQSVLLTFGDLLNNVQISARLNLDDFNGRFFLVHHLTGPASYDFFVKENESIRLGRMQNGSVNIFDSSENNKSDWITLKAVSSDGHYRGYVENDLAVHGHNSDLPPGLTGMALNGQGTIRLAMLEVLNLDKPTDSAGGREDQGHDGGSHAH